MKLRNHKKKKKKRFEVKSDKMIIYILKKKKPYNLYIIFTMMISNSITT